MSAAKAFIDTNVFVYMYSGTEPLKCKQAREIINQYDRFISTQVINEFCNVCTRKMMMDLTIIKASVDKIALSCVVADIGKSTVYKALDIHSRYGYSYYDSLIIASALESDCKYLLSEDMADNQVIEGCLTIKNIF